MHMHADTDMYTFIISKTKFLDVRGHRSKIISLIARHLLQCNLLYIFPKQIELVAKTRKALKRSNAVKELQLNENANKAPNLC